VDDFQAAFNRLIKVSGSLKSIVATLKHKHPQQHCKTFQAALTHTTKAA